MYLSHAYEGRHNQFFDLEKWLLWKWNLHFHFFQYEVFAPVIFLKKSLPLFLKNRFAYLFFRNSPHPASCLWLYPGTTVTMIHQGLNFHVWLPSIPTIRGHVAPCLKSHEMVGQTSFRVSSHFLHHFQGFQGRFPQNFATFQGFRA